MRGKRTEEKQRCVCDYRAGQASRHTHPARLRGAEIAGSRASRDKQHPVPRGALSLLLPGSAR
jgi:hypothetical protein